MKQILRYILKIILLIIFIICGIILITTTYFAEEIEESVISLMQYNIKSNLDLGEVEFTIYKNFPSASVKITNLLISESKEFNGDTLIFAKLAYVELSLFNIISRTNNIQNIIINNAKINIKYNEKNIPNFLVFKNNPENKNKLSITKISLLNTKLKIKKEVTKMDLSWHLNKSIISIDNKNYTFNTDCFSDKLFIGNSDFMNTKKIDFSANIKITKDTITILKSDINIENILVNLKGSILNGNTLDLKIEGTEQEIKQIITHLPKNIKLTFSPVIINGNLNFYSTLKGLINKNTNPLFEMKYEVTEGSFILKSIPFRLENIEINGDVSNGEEQNFNSTKIDFNSFNATTKNGDISGIFTITNLNNYFLSSEFKSSWDLAEVNKYFEESPFIGLTGRLSSKTIYNGFIAFDKRFKKMFLNSYHESDIKIEKANFKYNIYPLKFTFTYADFKINKNKILVNSSQLNISETDINFKGEAQNLIGYILEESPKTYVKGNIKSTYTNFSELITLDAKTKDKSKNIMPDWIDADVGIDAENFSYKNFIASDLTGSITYKNGELKGNNLNTQSLNGQIDCGFTFAKQKNNNLKLISNITLNKINIRNSFDAFNNYGQTFIVKEQLKGVGSAELYIESQWNPDFVMDEKKLKIKSHLVIEKGELIDFKPLENLSTYVSLDELKHVKFSTLENTIDVENEIITIPNMEIKSSALSVFLSGTHEFNHKINYNVTLLLSELLSTSFRKKNTEITEFGEEEKDGKIFNTIYLKMTGTTDNTEISLNKIRFMDDLSESIKKEKAIISNIFKSDILQKKETEEKENSQELEIEWNPEI